MLAFLFWIEWLLGLSGLKEKGTADPKCHDDITPSFPTELAQPFAKNYHDAVRSFYSEFS